jgi:small subunit ribosomal protein S17
MKATQEAVQAPAAVGARRNEKVGQVVSTKMQKTIVVEVEMRKAHAKYKRIVRSTKKFYAHDEQSSARMGDVVRIRETRPLSKLKRWSSGRDRPALGAGPTRGCRGQDRKSRPPTSKPLAASLLLPDFWRARQVAGSTEDRKAESWQLEARS